MTWAPINIFILISALILVWGWVKYPQIPARSDWRSRASLAGLSAPVVRVAAWAVAILLVWGHVSSSAVRYLTHVGVWIPIIGSVIGALGRPRLLLAIVPSCLGAVLFWFGTTLP
jgi:hypothetical protein